MKYNVIVERMSEVRKGTCTHTKNLNKRHTIFNMVLHINWDYVSAKKGEKKQSNKSTTC